MEKKKVLIAHLSSHPTSYYKEILPDYNVSDITYGPEIINKFEQVKPDFFIIDSNISSDNGFEVISEIRCLSAAVKIILLAGISVDCDEALNIGCDIFYRKPIDIEGLRKTLD